MKRQTKIFGAIAALFMIALSNGAVLADDLGRGYDWTVLIKTEPMENYLSKTNLSGVEKLNIHYYKGDKDDKKPTHYQKFYYHKGRPLGLERMGEFMKEEGNGAMKEEGGENVRFVLSHKNGKATKAEKDAAANAILRIVLDCQLKKNHITVVSVPDASLDGVADGLVHNRCEIIPQTPGDVEKPRTDTFNLFLKSEPEGRSIHLAYKSNN